MADAVETEWQFEAGDLERVAGWLAAQPGHAPLSFVPTQDRVQVDRYYDTADWRLYYAGFSLRRRQSGSATELTLKGLERSAAGGVAGATSRREITQSVEGEELSALASGGSAGAVADRVRLITGGHPLRLLFDVRTRRRTYEVRRAVRDEARIAVVELDETTIAPPHGTPATLSRVEVELDGRVGASGVSGTADVEAFVAAMARDCFLRPAATSKFVAGLAAAGHDPYSAMDFGPTTHEALPGLPLDAAGFAYAWLRRHWAAFLRHEPGTRLAEEIEPLHQMRVSTRRLRATIALFAEVLPPVMSHLRDELRWVGHELGAVRDLDVQIDALERLRAVGGWEDASALAPLVEVMERDRRAERERLLALLDSTRYDGLVEDMSAALRAGPPADRVRVDVLGYGEPILKKRYRRLRAAGRRLTATSPAVEYHALRIVAKRFRYSLELFGELYGKPAERMTAAVRTLQDLLGEHQDAEVAMQRLRALVSRHPELPPETLVAIGELRERYRTQEAGYRDRFPRAYRGVVSTARPLQRAIASRRPEAPPPADTEAALDAPAAPLEASAPPAVAERQPAAIPPPPSPVDEGAPLSRMRQLFHRD